MGGGTGRRVVSGSSSTGAPTQQVLATAGLKPKKIRLLPEVPSQDLMAYRPSDRGATSARTDAVMAAAETTDDAVRRLREWNGDASTSASLEQVWEDHWLGSSAPEKLHPTRIRLRAKLTKRCATCNHTLIRPEAKASSTRYKIKVVAMDYLPALELGNRRRLKGVEGAFDRTSTSISGASSSQEDVERSVSRLNTLMSVRDVEEKEKLERPFTSGSTVSLYARELAPLR